MSQIMCNYPAMSAHAGAMNAYATTHEPNTLMMNARDTAEAAKWG